MSYQIKRVPLNFKADLYEVWPGRLLTNDKGDWRPIEPPIGEGWQLWENVSEGSPITPVFTTRSAFVAHLVTDEELELDDANAHALVLKGSVPSALMTIYPDGSHDLYFSNRIPALTDLTETPDTDDISDWLQHHRDAPQILAIHYGDDGVPIHAIISENGQPIYWFFRYSFRDARLYRTRCHELPINAPINQWMPGEPIPDHATFAPATLWENSDEAPDGCYWNGYLNSWLPNNVEPSAKALNDDWIARGSPKDNEEDD